MAKQIVKGRRRTCRRSSAAVLLVRMPSPADRAEQFVSIEPFGPWRRSGNGLLLSAMSREGHGRWNSTSVLGPHAARAASILARRT